MARRRFAPTHTLTGTPRYVPAQDTAWREDKIPSLAKQRDHAYWRYARGETRYDLDDPELVECLDLEANPEIWTLRPLTIKQIQRVSFLQRRDLLEDANEYAFLRGVVSTENLVGEPGTKLAKLFEAKKRDYEAIVEAVGAYALETIDDVGNAVIRLSQDLSPVEKKASGSPPGDSSPSQGT